MKNMSLLVVAGIALHVTMGISAQLLDVCKRDGYEGKSCNIPCRPGHMCIAVLTGTCVNGSCVQKNQGPREPNKMAEEPMDSTVDTEAGEIE